MSNEAIQREPRLAAPDFVLPGDAAPAGLASGAFASRPVRIDRSARPRRRRRTVLTARFLPVIVALAAVAVFSVLTNGGQRARAALPTTAHLGKLLAAAGLGLNQVTLGGQKMTSDDAIYRELRLAGEHSVWLYDTAAARARIEQLPWVAAASLKRRFPDGLHIAITERVPRAVWRDEAHRSTLIDRNGRHLGPALQNLSHGLPVVFGAGAASHVDAIVTAVSRIAALRDRVGLFEWTANRRWTLHLTSGQRILLPARAPGRALLRLTESLDGGPPLLALDFEQIDMRLADLPAIILRGGPAGEKYSHVAAADVARRNSIAVRPR